MIQSTEIGSLLEEKDKQSVPHYSIGVVAKLMGTTNQTLRLYEKHGLIKPSRKNKNRLYSENDIRWLRCLRELIHKKKISIEGIKKLLTYAPCWDLSECPEEKKDKCLAYVDRTKPCWELNLMICKDKTNRRSRCEECAVFISNRTKIRQMP